MTGDEKAQLETSSDLSHLDLKSRNDFSRRLSFESSRAQDAGDRERARYFAEKNLIIRQDIVKDFPESYFDKLSLAVSLSSLGLVEQKAGKFSLARDYFKKSMAQLEDNPPDAENESLWLRLVMWRHRDLGHLEKELKDYQSAQKNYESFLNYVVKNPSHDEYLHDHAEAYFFLGDLFLEQAYFFKGDYADEQAIWFNAVENYERSIRLLEKHIAQEMTRNVLIIWRRLAETYGKLAYASYYQSNIDETEIASENCIEARKQALDAPRAGTSDELDLALAYYSAATYTDGKDNEYYQAASEIFQGLKAKDAVPERFETIVDKTNKALAK